jgi:hypothetical protein
VERFHAADAALRIALAIEHGDPARGAVVDLQLVVMNKRGIDEVEVLRCARRLRRRCYERR